MDEMDKSELIELINELQGTVKSLLETNLSLNKRIDSLLTKIEEKEETLKVLRKERERLKKKYG